MLTLIACDAIRIPTAFNVLEYDSWLLFRRIFSFENIQWRTIASACCEARRYDNYDNYNHVGSSVGRNGLYWDAIRLPLTCICVYFL